MAEGKATAKKPARSTGGAPAKKTAKKPVRPSGGAASSSAAAKKTPAKKAATKKAADSKTFAVIETGGKQYVVREGEELKIEKLSGEHKEGDKVVFDKVLLLDDGTKTTVGEPYIDGAKVEAEISEIGRGKKISVIRFRSKSRYFKNKGHRQPYMSVKVSAVK